MDPAFPNTDQPRYIAIIGPTASGKSALAMSLAAELQGELVNCDSIQLYRGFNIGAAKPQEGDFQKIPHHLWDILDWNQDYDANLYAEAAHRTLQDIRKRGSIPIVVGGTGLYLRALWREQWHDLPKSEELRLQLSNLSPDDLHVQLRNRDPQRAEQLHPNDRFRLQRALEITMLLGHPMSLLPGGRSERPQAYVIRACCPREELHCRIAARAQHMLEQGLIKEVEDLLLRGVDPRCKPMQSIGYLQVTQCLEGRLPRDGLAEAIQIATRQYAKRQETWFRKVDENASWTVGTEIGPLLEALSLEFKASP